jgi:hypothetical protein
MPVHGCSWPYMVIVAHVSCADVTPGPKRRPRRTAQSARSASPEAGSPPRVPHTATSSSTFTPSATAATAVSPDTSARTRLWPPTRPPTSTRSTFGTQEGVMRLATSAKTPCKQAGLQSPLTDSNRRPLPTMEDQGRHERSRTLTIGPRSPCNWRKAEYTAATLDGQPRRNWWTEYGRKPRCIVVTDFQG